MSFPLKKLIDSSSLSSNTVNFQSGNDLYDKRQKQREYRDLLEKQIKAKNENKLSNLFDGGTKNRSEDKWDFLNDAKKSSNDASSLSSFHYPTSFPTAKSDKDSSMTAAVSSSISSNEKNDGNHNADFATILSRQPYSYYDRGRAAPLLDQATYAKVLESQMEEDEKRKNKHSSSLSFSSNNLRRHPGAVTLSPLPNRKITFSSQEEPETTTTRGIGHDSSHNQASHSSYGNDGSSSSNSGNSLMTSSSGDPYIEKNRLHQTLLTSTLIPLKENTKEDLKQRQQEYANQLKEQMRENEEKKARERDYFGLVSNKKGNRQRLPHLNHLASPSSNVVQQRQIDYENNNQLNDQIENLKASTRNKFQTEILSPTLHKFSGENHGSMSINQSNYRDQVQHRLNNGENPSSPSRSLQFEASTNEKINYGKWTNKNNSGFDSGKSKREIHSSPYEKKSTRNIARARLEKDIYGKETPWAQYEEEKENHHQQPDSKTFHEIAPPGDHPTFTMRNHHFTEVHTDESDLPSEIPSFTTTGQHALVSATTTGHGGSSKKDGKVKASFAKHGSLAYDPHAFQYLQQKADTAYEQRIALEQQIEEKRKKKEAEKAAQKREEELEYQKLLQEKEEQKLAEKKKKEAAMKEALEVEREQREQEEMKRKVETKGAQNYSRNIDQNEHELQSSHLQQYPEQRTISDFNPLNLKIPQGGLHKNRQNKSTSDGDLIPRTPIGQPQDIMTSYGTEFEEKFNSRKQEIKGEEKREMEMNNLKNGPFMMRGGKQNLSSPSPRQGQNQQSEHLPFDYPVSDLSNATLQAQMMSESKASLNDRRNTLRSSDFGWTNYAKKKRN